MKSRVVILVIVVMVSLLLGWRQTSGGLASPEGSPVGLHSAAQQTPAAPSQPLPPSVTTGANAPLVCGATLLLIIIVGGVVWNARLRKTKPHDH